MKMIVKVPKKIIDVGAIDRIISNTLDAVSKDVKVDFLVTTKTWKHKPGFKVTKKKYERLVGTDDQIYEWVDVGTAPHIIRPKNGKVLTWMGGNYRAKTKPYTIGSTKGGNDNTIVYTKQVQHPGFPGRKFAWTIAEKWRKQFPVVMQRAIDSEVK